MIRYWFEFVGVIRTPARPRLPEMPIVEGTVELYGRNGF